MAELYAIFGVSKLKTIGNIEAVRAHMLRTRYTANSNGKQNRIMIQPPALPELQKLIESYQPRKNSVLCYDTLLAASPEFFKGKTEEELQAWEDASLLWAKNTFGEANVLGCVSHRDETSPHLQLLILPAVDGRLNARAITGGREKLRKLWTSYGKAMQPYGLQRGREYSPAKHKDIQAYYADVNEAKAQAKAKMIKASQLPAPSLEDRLNPREYAASLINFVETKLIKENANLRAALRAGKTEKEALVDSASRYRKLYQNLKEDPELLHKLQEAYKRERAAKAQTAARFNELINAIKTFFNNNIPVNSVMRKPDALGALRGFPELLDSIELQLTIERNTEGRQRGRSL